MTHGPSGRQLELLKSVEKHQRGLDDNRFTLAPSAASCEYLWFESRAEILDKLFVSQYLMDHALRPIVAPLQ